MNDVEKPAKILILPAGCKEVPFSRLQRAYWWGELSIICSIEEHEGSRWLHVSCAKRLSLPSWEDLKMVKDTFVGRNRMAIQVLPREDKYVNVNPFCLHLYSAMKEDFLPDFTGGKNIL